MTPAADAAAQTSGATLIRGGAWTAISHLLPQLYALAVSIAAARFLGPSDFGRQSFIAFVALATHLVLADGVALALMRSVAEALGRARPDEARGLVAWAWRLQILAALVGGGILLAAAVFGADPQGAWAFAGAFALMAILQTVPSAVLLGAQRFREVALVGLVTGGLAVPATIWVLAEGGGITGIFAIEAVVATLNLLWVWLLSRRLLRSLSETVAPVPELRAPALRFAAWTTASALVSLVVWRRSEFFLLSAFSTDVEIGLYSIAFAVVTALATLPERVSTVLVSAFATLRGADAIERVRSGFSRSLRLLIVFTLPFTAGTAAVGPPVLELVYGDEYVGAGPVLIILAVAMPFLAVSTISAALMSGFEDARTPLAAGAIAAVANLLLALILIPPLDAIGAAAANVGGQLVATAALFAGARRVVGPVRWEPAALLRSLAAAAGCFLAAWGALQAVDGVLGVAAGTAAGTLAFAALAVALRILPADDGAWLEGNLGHHLGGWAGRVARRAAARGATA